MQTTAQARLFDPHFEGAQLCAALQGLIAELQARLEASILQQQACGGAADTLTAELQAARREAQVQPCTSAYVPWHWSASCTVNVHTMHIKRRSQASSAGGQDSCTFCSSWCRH